MKTVLKEKNNIRHNLHFDSLGGQKHNLLLLKVYCYSNISFHWLVHWYIIIVYSIRIPQLRLLLYSLASGQSEVGLPPILHHFIISQSKPKTMQQLREKVKKTTQNTKVWIKLWSPMATFHFTNLRMDSCKTTIVSQHSVLLWCTGGTDILPSVHHSHWCFCNTISI